MKERPSRPGRLRRLATRVAALVIASLTACASLRASRAVLERDAASVYAGDAQAERALAKGAASWGTTTSADYDTGSALFDREWAFGAPAMRAACLAQVILRDPAADAELGADLDRAVEAVLAPAARAFSRERWGSDPIEGTEEGHAHAAYLGYAGVALGLASWAHPKWAPMREKLVARLRHRLDAAGDAWLETYPGESYPPDLAMGAGALGLDDGAGPVSVERQHLAARLRSRIDPESGLLFQSVVPTTGEPRDGARGSGTFLAVYALLYADPDLSRDLYARARELRATRLGFLGMREHPEGAAASGDIDSGPVILDLGVSSTGFALAGARALTDEETYLGLDATARLFAVPLERADGGVVSLAGGPLGDAILCAMRTAPTPVEAGAWRARAATDTRGGAS